eukprot:15432922-Alexandrium_andersonii.AAC.1
MLRSVESHVTDPALHLAELFASCPGRSQPPSVPPSDMPAPATALQSPFAEHCRARLRGLR